MSGAQTSSFGPLNQLFDMGSGQALQRGRDNELLIQQHQQAIGAQELEVGARVASALLSLPAEQRAEAYPRLVGMAQTQGFMKQAPPSYPGDDHARALAQMGVSSEKQFEYGAGRTAAQGAIGALGIGVTPPPPGAAGGTVPSLAIPPRGTGGPGGGAEMPPEYLNYFREASAETGIPMDLLIAQARQESSFNPKARGAAGEIGLFQIKPSTAQQPGFGMTGVDPATLDDPRSNILFGARYLRGRMGQGDPNDPRVQSAGLAAYNGGGDPNYVANVNRYRPGLAPSDPAAQVTTYTPGGAAQTAAGGPATPAPYRVAGPTVAPPGTAVAAPAAAPVSIGNLGLVRNSDGSVSTPNAGGLGTGAPPQQPAAPAQQPAATPATPAPSATPQVPLAPLLPLQPSGLTAQQEAAAINDLHSPGMTPARATAITAHYQALAQQNRTANAAAEQQNFERQRQAAGDVRQTQQDAQAREEKAKADAIAAENLRLSQHNSAREDQKVAAEEMPALLRIAPKILDGSTTDAERREYSAAMEKVFTKPTLQFVPDPDNPKRQVQAMVRGQVPAGFPAPDYRPPGTSTQPGAPASAPDVNVIPGTGKPVQEPKPLPEAERKVLLDTAGRLDQVNEQLSTLKPDYTGFTNATVGDIANMAARNLPASQTAIDRAQWWSDYQRYKLAVRQGISGQSLTASEMSEFDKADINPGMTYDVIRRNLDHQASVLRTSHERRVGSLAADSYNPEAIKAASGIDPATVTARPVGQSPTKQPEQKQLPPGWKTVIP